VKEPASSPERACAPKARSTPSAPRRAAG
jgi:hypothetical protein